MNGIDISSYQAELNAVAVFLGATMHISTASYNKKEGE